MLKHLSEVPVNPARVVVLGAGGFVSSAITPRLEVQGVSMLALPQTELDLMDADAASRLAEMLRLDDSLLFVAAKAPVKNNGMLIDNLSIAKTVCEALTKAAVSHVVYISSDAVYADSRGPLTESSCAQPGSLHGVMHLAREVMLANAWNGPLCFLRPTLIYGTGDPHNGYGPNRFLRLAAAGNDIVLFGEGEELRDHVWIEDVAEIACRVLLRKSTGIINIATGEVVSFREIAERVVKMFPGSSSQVKGSPRSGPMPHNGYRPFDASATREAFPDFQYTHLREGLTKVIL
jgi:nucleoside-diphosphate-sugar epimerase